MQSYKQYAATDEISLFKVCERYGFLSSAYEKLLDAYTEYERTQGSPNLRSLGLDKDAVSCLHALYNGAAKLYGLDWMTKIKSYVSSSCPMCGNTAMGTIEHYLPKTPFPEFSIYSNNLVPSCFDCNNKRGSRHLNGVAEKFIHPIYDLSILERLLLITIFDVSRNKVRFRLGYNSSLFSPAECGRIEFHIKMNVLVKSYRFVTLNYRSEFKARAEGKFSEVALTRLINKELGILQKSGGGHCWRGAFLRGLLEVSHAERLAVLKGPKLAALA